MRRFAHLSPQLHARALRQSRGGSLRVRPVTVGSSLARATLRRWRMRNRSGPPGGAHRSPSRFMAICALVFLVGLVSPIAQREIFLRFSPAQLSRSARASGGGSSPAPFCTPGRRTSRSTCGRCISSGRPSSGRSERRPSPRCAWPAPLRREAVYLLTGPRSAVVGASSAIFGVFGAWLYASYLSRESPMGQRSSAIS